MQQLLEHNKNTVLKRNVDADHSCLFSSIAYLTDRANFDETSSAKYRNMIVEYLKSNDDFDALLDVDKENYIEQICKPHKWGGGIEISIFSKIFKIKIAVVDGKTNRIDLFGEDQQDYKNVIYIYYTGIHYDPLVMNKNEDEDSKTDITTFEASDIATRDSFKSFGLQCKEDGQFFDFESFKKRIKKEESDNSDDEGSSSQNKKENINLECVDCETKFTCKKSATEHARETDHWTFKEI